jgi:hypothetical protein
MLIFKIQGKATKSTSSAKQSSITTRSFFRDKSWRRRDCFNSRSKRQKGSNRDK